MKKKSFFTSKFQFTDLRIRVVGARKRRQGVLLETERPNFYIDEKNTVGFSCEFLYETIDNSCYGNCPSTKISLTHCYYTITQSLLLYINTKKKLSANWQQTLIGHSYMEYQTWKPDITVKWFSFLHKVKNHPFLLVYILCVHVSLSR